MLRLNIKYTRLGDDEPIRVPQLDGIDAVEITVGANDEGFAIKLYMDVDGVLTVEPSNRAVLGSGRWKPSDDVRQASLGEPCCPKCGGRMWDNRLSKRNPKAPDYKCRSRACPGVIWPRSIT